MRFRINYIYILGILGSFAFGVLFGVATGFGLRIVLYII